MTDSEKNNKSTTAPSLLDARSVGGLDCWGGITAQLRYTLAALPRWLADPSFIGFQPERAEDVDVFFEVEGRRFIDCHQVKTGTQTPSDIKGYVAAFHKRNLTAIEGGRTRHFIVASPTPTQEVRGAFVALGRFRTLPIVDAADPERVATLSDLRTQFVGRGIVDHADFEFVLEHVSFMPDWGGLEPENEPWGRITGEFGQLAAFGHLVHGELDAAVKELARHIDQRKRYFWRRDEVLAVLTDAVARWRAGPPTASGDVVFLCHQSRASVRTHPDASALPDRLRAARVLRYSVAHPELADPKDWAALPRELASMFITKGPLEEALAMARTTPVLYYGFPHIPFAALVGYLLGEQADVQFVEHDQETGLFSWPATTTTAPTLEPKVVDSEVAGALVLRISISATVAPEVCKICVQEPRGVEVDCAVATPGRGIVRSQAQARAYAKVIRQTLDPLVAGNPRVTSIHIFAAVPVSVAFLTGQIASSTGYPPSFVYNFRKCDVPPYYWGLCLQKARHGDGLVLPVATRGAGATP